MKHSVNAIIHEGASVADSTLLGDYVVIYSRAHLAEDSAVHGFTQVWSGVRLERGASLGSGVNLEHPTNEKSTIEFGENCQIGAGSTIREGVKINEGAIVEPGSVVAQNVPPYAIVSGTPARIIGYVENQTQLHDKPWHRQADFPDNPSITRIGVGNVSLHRFKLVRDPRGDLSVGEFLKDIPFYPKRYFLVFNVSSDKTRGEHAHHKCHQFLICVKGRCAVVVDDAQSRYEVLLESPDMGLYLPPLTWGTQYKYSSDAVLLVFASEYYQANDYIRNYSEFISIAGNKSAI
jgi:acetyltransferase-like isoleucine patch superfamily enzyme/dTDP-4-dehydrorhamnose 3,5-epimerase-like enzyme